MTAPTGKRITWLVAALVVVRLVSVGVALEGADTRGKKTVLPGDVRRFHAIAQHPGEPYRDFAVEYPPLTLGAVELLDGRTVRDSTVRLMWSQLVLDLVIAAVIAWGWGKRASVVYLLLGLAFVWYPFLYLRLDLLSVLLAVGGLALVRRRRSGTGAALLALACFAKVWPIALAPTFLVRRTPRSALLFATVAALGLVAWIAVGGMDAPVQVITFRGATGWQIESTVGALLHTFGHGVAHMEAGAMRTGVVPEWARIGLPACGLAMVAGVWTIANRTRSRDAVVI
ncbi:MAG TPA: glycosyltransferase 87 family protein, partial [Acidimicrobiia bacterium]